jgi:hypothetical protein
MDPKPADNPSSYPPLGRALMWFTNPANAGKIFFALIGICLLTFLADFTYKKYGHFAVEYIPGFYAAYGFVMFAGLILAAKTLRVFIKRPEDFYGDKAIDRESYPEAELEQVGHDDA